MKLGIIHPSKSKWSSPLHLVSKNSNTWCASDYRALNAVTKPDKYPVPLYRTTPVGQNNQIFTKLDLIPAYHQIPIELEHIPKRAITTFFFNLFIEFLLVTFGLQNAAQKFQRFIDQVLRDLPFVCAYIDDVSIASQNEQEHKSGKAYV